MKPALQLNTIEHPTVAASRSLAPGAVELDLHEIVGALALALVGATVLIARSLPIRSYTALHHSYTGDRAGPRAQHPQP